MERLKGWKLRSFLGAGGFLCACALGGSAQAHHSFAMFDRTRTTEISGTVKEFQWTNPHVWIQLLVQNGQGGADEWGIECTSINFMTRRGWDHGTLKAGDRVTLDIFPLKDGSKGGSFAKVVTLNGSALKLAPED